MLGEIPVSGSQKGSYDRILVVAAARAPDCCGSRHGSNAVGVVTKDEFQERKPRMERKKISRVFIAL
jgi:hypothetical protein